MSSDEKPMTKTEAQAYIRRAREGLRWMEDALKRGDLQQMAEACGEACGEASGSIAEVQDAVEGQFGRGIRGLQ